MFLFLFFCCTQDLGRVTNRSHDGTGEISRGHNDSSAPQSKNTVCILNHMKNTFFCCGKLLKQLADNQCSSITKWSILYQTYRRPHHIVTYGP